MAQTPAAPAEDPNAKYRMAANAIIKAGPIPFAPSDTFIEILKYYLDQKDLDFIKYFKVTQSLSIDEILKKAKTSEEEIERKANKLAKKGFIFNQPSSSGKKVYRLLPIVVVGTFEYTYMRPLPTDTKTLDDMHRLANLYKKLISELTDKIQSGYDNVAPMFKAQPPVDRTIPIYENVTGSNVEIAINQTIDAKEVVLPAQTVEDIIKKFDDIAVGNCFCRQYQKMLGHNCVTNAPVEVCFTFGKSARFVSQQGFARKISKEEALKILKATEEAGLVHKAFHNGSDITKDENSICNCCKDCCDTFNFWRMGATPMVNSTNYLSQINQDGCTGCGTCVERCPMDAISLNNDNKAEVKAEICIGCGVCAHFCPQNTISLKKGMRTVFAMPPRLKK